MADDGAKDEEPVTPTAAAGGGEATTPTSPAGGASSTPVAGGGVTSPAPTTGGASTPASRIRRRNMKFAGFKVHVFNGQGGPSSNADPAWVNRGRRKEEQYAQPVQLMAVLMGKAVTCIRDQPRRGRSGEV